MCLFNAILCRNARYGLARSLKKSSHVLIKASLAELYLTNDFEVLGLSVQMEDRSTQLALANGNCAVLNSKHV